MLLLRADGTHGARTAPRRACRRLGGSATRSSGRRQRQLLASKGATRRERAGLTPAGGRAPCARHPGFRGGKRPRPRSRARAAREPGALTGERGDTGTCTRWRCASWPSRGDPDTTGEAASLDLGSEDGREGRTDAGRTARSRPPRGDGARRVDQERGAAMEGGGSSRGGGPRRCQLALRFRFSARGPRRGRHSRLPDPKHASPGRDAARPEQRFPAPF